MRTAKALVASVVGLYFFPFKTSALRRQAHTVCTPGRAQQRLSSYAMVSGRGMLIMLHVFFPSVCFFIVLLCVTVFGRNQRCLTLWVMRSVCVCVPPVQPLNPLMHNVLLGFIIVACFDFFACSFGLFCRLIIVWLEAQREASSEKRPKFASHLNRISIASFSCYGCLFAVSTQSASFDLWPSEMKKSCCFFSLHGGTGHDNITQLTSVCTWSNHKLCGQNSTSE